MMNNRVKLFFSVGFVVLLALVLGTIGGIVYQRNCIGDNLSGQIKENKLLYTLDLLKESYVESIDVDSLTEILVPKLLETLDPHSEYIPANDMQSMNEPLEGKFDGIGVLFNMSTDTVIVSNVISGGPSAKSGVMAGDRIVSVNDSIIAGKKLDVNKVVKTLRGPRGTTVKLGIKRGYNDKLITISVKRGEIPVKSITAAFIVEPSVGYIKIERFAANTFNEFKQEIANLQKNGMKKLVLDLRDNGGGYLDPAIFIANEFLPKGAGIVYTQGISHKREDVNADGRGRLLDIPLTILIGPQSASASEVLAGALQDNDRATIVGLRSFGKGLIQKQFEYGDGSAARITVAHYFTPLGRSIQKKYEKGSKENYQMEIYDRLNHSEFLNEDSIKKDITQKFITKGGKILYGGGGIHPDLFVPMDTTRADSYFKKLVENNLIFRYASLYSDKNRTALNTVKTFGDMDKLFAKSNLYMDFVAWADRQGVKPTDKQMVENKQLILAQLQAYISSNSKLEQSGAVYYIKPIDRTLNKGLETFLVN